MIQNVLIVLEQLRTKKQPERKKNEYARTHYEKTKIYLQINKELIYERQKAYVKEHREQRLNTIRNYYINHKEQIRAKTKCECGAEVSKDHMKRHEQAQKHMNFINSQK